MDRVLEIVKKYGTLTILLMVMVIFFRTCGMNNNIENVKKEVINFKIINDTITTLTNKNITSISKSIKQEIKKEGLRSEHRMIQATDRKMIDVNRQNEIEKELKKLENNE